MSSYGPTGNEVVQGQTVESPLRTPQTLHSLEDGLGSWIRSTRIIVSTSHVLDIVGGFEPLEALCPGVVNVLGKGDESRRRRRSVGSCDCYDFLVTYFRTDLYFFETFYFSFGIDHDPPCSHDHVTYVYSFSYVSQFIRLYGQEKSLSYYDLFDFGVLFYGCIPTLIFFYFLHNSTTPILPVHIDQRQTHLEKDSTRMSCMVQRKVLCVPGRTLFAPD